MKRKIISGALILAPFFVSSQWRTEVVQNDFDEQYRIAYNNSSTNEVKMGMENFDGELFFYFQINNQCSEIESSKVDIVFVMPDNSKRYYSFNVFLSDDESIIVLDYFESVDAESFLDSFKKSTSMKVKFNCDSDEYINFNQSKSSFAYKFVNS